MKCLEKNLDENYTRMLYAVLNKSWKQHSKKSSCTAIYLPSYKPSKTKLDMLSNAGEIRVNS